MAAKSAQPVRVSLIAAVCVTISAAPGSPQPAPTPAQSSSALQKLIDDDAQAHLGRPISLVIAALFQSDLVKRAVAFRDQATPRTDQQLGSSAAVSHGVALVDKPGISDFASLGIERDKLAGKSATAFTLATTPFALYYLSTREDTPESWDNHKVLRSLSLKVTFQAGPGTQPFDHAELKYVLFGNRSPRDKAFRDNWVKTASERLGKAQDDYTRRLKLWFDAHPAAGRALDDAFNRYDKWRQGEGPTTTSDKIRQELDVVILELRRSLSAQDRSGLSRAVSASILQDPELQQEVSKMLDDAAERYAEAAPEISAAYGFAHDPSTSDYSYVSVASSWQHTPLVSSDVSAELSINDSLTSATSAPLKRLRGYSGGADVTFGKWGKKGGPQLDIDLGAKYERDEMSASNILSASITATVYPIGGVSVPLSYTYANRTVDSARHDSRFNVGLSVDAAGLIAAFKPAGQ